MQESDTESNVRLATKEDSSAITHIYRLVQIEPGQFLELTRLDCDRAALLEHVKSIGGFISPPDERDMEMTLNHGLVLVYVQDQEVLGYYRFLTRPDKVFEALCEEFQIDQSIRKFSPDSFLDWSGSKRKLTGVNLRTIRWVDRERAAFVFNTACESLVSNTGHLAWTVDVAVHPESRSAGVSRALVKRMHQEFKPVIRFNIFRIFEICKINDMEFNIENKRSTHTFVNSASCQFAYTEEEIALNSDVSLLVRWNYWLKQY
jgi:hypothetical protein